MHLKNYSLLIGPDGSAGLAPAYDLLATKLVIPQDPEESALTLNGKKSRLSWPDFHAFSQNAGIPEPAVEKILLRFRTRLQSALDLLASSFLSKPAQEQYRELLLERAQRLGIVETIG